MDYLLYSRYLINGLSLEERFNTPEDALRTFNLLVLSYKYLRDLNQIAFLTSKILNIILRKQKKAILSGTDNNPLVGAWIIGVGEEDIEDEIPMRSGGISLHFYDYVIYPTVRAIDSLSSSKGVSSSTILRGVNFLSRIFDESVDVFELAPERFVPVMDAVFNIFVSDILPYEKMQKFILPLAEKVAKFAVFVDPDKESMYTRDILLKLKLMRGKGLDQDDAQYIGRLLEVPILKNVLKALLWLLKFGVEIPPMIPELLMDLLIENYGLVFDIHKNNMLMYYVSNAETLSEILTDYSDKKFAQIILDRTVEYVAESVLQGISDVFSAVKLLLIAKILIEARAIIRR